MSELEHIAFAVQFIITLTSPICSANISQKQAVLQAILTYGKINLLSPRRTDYVWILLIILEQVETGRRIGPELEESQYLNLGFAWCVGIADT